MKENKERFIIRQRWLLRLYLIWIILTSVVMGLLFTFIEQVDDSFAWLESIIVVMLFAPFALLGWAIVELFIYLVRIRKLSEPPRVWRSVVVLVTSPLATVLYIIFMFVVLASFASCTYTG